MSWSLGLALWIAGALVVMWLWGEIVDRFARTDRHDWLADRKRKITHNGFKSRMGVK